jgi:hypothetical protein
MSFSRRASLRNWRKHFISRSAETVAGSAFNAASFGGIGVELIAEIPDLKP